MRIPYRMPGAREKYAALLARERWIEELAVEKLRRHAAAVPSTCTLFRADADAFLELLERAGQD